MNILQELHLLLAPDKEHKKVFPNVPVVGFCNGKSLKTASFELAYVELMKLGDVNHVGKKLVCL